MSRDRINQEFVEATYQILLTYLRRLIGNRETAEDLAQTAYEEVFRNPAFDPSRPDAIGFLKKKARWLVQDHRRRPVRATALPADAVDPLADGPDTACEREEARARLVQAVAMLGEAQRAVILIHLRGMNHAEIASTLGIPIQAVYRHFHKAKAALRRVLKSERQEGSQLPH